jgi:hypothetical protein
MAKEHWANESEFVDKVYNIGSEIVIEIAMIGNAGIPVAPSIRHDNVVILLQRPR